MMDSMLTALKRLFMCVALAAAPAVWADCVDTVGLTPQEKDFYQRANAVLKSLLRPAPVADKLWSRDSIADPNQIETCKSDKKPGNFTVTVSRKYVWPDPKGNSADSVVTLSLAINADRFDLKEPTYSGAYGSPSPTRSAGLKVLNVVWSLSGSSYGLAAQTEALRASLADGLERERMEKLVGRPLPTVGESDALGKRALPTKLLATATATAPVAAVPAIAPPPPMAATVPASGLATAQPQAATPNTSPVSSAAANNAPEAPSTPSALEAAKAVGDSIQKLRGLFGK